MKGFLATLVVVCAIIGGIWFAYEPYIKPLLEKSDTVLTDNGTTMEEEKPAEPAPSAPKPSASKAANAPVATKPVVAAKSELDLLLEEKYPMPEIIPLEEIVDGWRNVPPRAFPEEVTSSETIAFQLVVNGQAIGSSNVAPGTPLKPVRLEGTQLTIANAANPGMNTVVEVDKTDFKTRIEGRYNAYVEKVTGEVKARRDRVREVVEADPGKMALLTGETPPPAASDSGDPRFGPVKASLQAGEAASVTLEEAKTFTWNGSEKIGGDSAGTFDTVTVHFEVSTIFGRFPVDYKALLQGGKVVAWIDPITEERI